jgi:ankyrin repeat protein
LQVNAKGRLGWTPLYIAARSGFTSIAALLLAAGAEVEAPSDEKATPLYVACEYGRPGVVSCSRYRFTVCVCVCVCVIFNDMI